jgi:hypothetical protein
VINGSCEIKALSSLGKKGHSIPVFELECLEIMSAVRIFWGVINGTVGFNI